MALPKDYTESHRLLCGLLRAEESFDLIDRVIDIGGRRASLFFIDGLVKDEVMEKILEFFYAVESFDDLQNAEAFMKKRVPYVEVTVEDDPQKICTDILSGVLLLLIDGYEAAITLDVRTYPARETAEPEKDKVLRGARDGFVETLVMNTALIRRRVRDPKLTMRIFTVGSRSKTDVVVCYMDDKVDHKLLEEVCGKIESVQVESLTMSQQSLAEAIYRHRWYNPFPKFKYTERPDTAAASVLEGNIVILVDNSPSAVILPTSIFDVMEEADDYYFPPITGTYLRLSRYLVTLVTLILTPLWLLFLQSPHLTPPWLQFILIDEAVNVPILWQLLILELAIDGLRLASVNTPTTLSTSLSVIAAIVVGDFAVQSGWFNAEALLYMAFVAIANYSQPSLELGYALKFLRITLLVLTAVLRLWGFIAGLVLVFLLLACNRTISGKSYLYPLIPFHGKALLDRFARRRLPQQTRK